MPSRIFAVRAADSLLFEPSTEELKGLLKDPSVFVWVSLEEQDEASSALLRDVFDFHPLLIEDVFADATTPKCEDMGEYLYLIVHGLANSDLEPSAVAMGDLDLFLGERYLITHHTHDLASVERVRAELEKDPSLLGRGPAFVAHRLLDHMIDRFVPLMEYLDTEIDELERAVMEEGGAEVLPRIFRLKHSLQRIRRISLHQLEVFHSLSNGNLRLIPDDARPFFRDVYDHFVRVADLTEGYREMVVSVLDGHMSMQSHRLNEAMRVLTVISTIMLPLTFVTGLYGMNFDYMPGLHWAYGYEAAWVVMLAVAGFFFVMIKRRGWV